MKLRRLSATIEFHFLRKQAVLILTPSETAAKYIDDFLWKQPKESFLPHIISQETTREQIVITTRRENLNNAHVLINLTPEQIPFFKDLTIGYELWDETDPKKKFLAEKKQHEYQSAGHDIELLYLS